MVKQKDSGIYRSRTQKTTRERIIQLEEINQKVLAKEGRLKRYQQTIKQYRQNRTYQNNERKFNQQLGGHDTKTTQQPDDKETEQIWTKIWQPKKHNKEAEWINDKTRELGLEEGPKVEIHIELLKKTLKKISKRQYMMEYMDSGSRNSPPFTTD